MQLVHIFEQTVTDSDDLNTWNQLKTVLKTECKPYIQTLKKGSSPLYRGVGGEINWSKPTKIKKNRDSVSTPESIHRAIDNAMESAVDVKGRSSTAFVTMSEEQAEVYGRLYAVFPKGNFKLVWVQYIRDLYLALRGNKFGADWKNKKFDNLYRKVVGEVLDFDFPENVDMQELTADIWFANSKSDVAALVKRAGSAHEVLGRIFSKLALELTDKSANAIPEFGPYSPELMLSADAYYLVPMQLINTEYGTLDEMVKDL